MPTDIYSATQAIRARPLLAYLIATAFVVLALYLRHVAGQALIGFPFLSFFIAILLASLLGGLGPGVYALVLSTISATLVLPALGVVRATTLGWLPIVLFFTTGLAFTSLMSMVMRAFAERDAAQAALQRTVAGLEETVLARTAALRAEQDERNRAEQQVRQMQKIESIGQLTGGIAHDFNNMLSVVTGSLDLAERRLATNDTTRAAACIEKAKLGTKRAADLTAQLLAFSRQSPLRPETIDANELVERAVELLRRTLGETVRIDTVLGADLWRIHADTTQLESALINLAINARDAMSGSGRLVVQTENVPRGTLHGPNVASALVGDAVLIAVTDSGCGMDADTLSRAFDPFFSTKGVGKGTGLGLSQVYGFVHQSGGDIAIESTVGVGTTVRIYLPRHLGEAIEPPRAPEATRVVSHASQGAVVLLVEDQDEVREMAKASLEELGYDVLCANGGRQALDLLQTGLRVDLLFTDIVMPEMSGRQLARHALAARPALPVLFTTGYSRNEATVDREVEPDLPVLQKPYTLDQLDRQVRAILARGTPRPLSRRADRAVPPSSPSDGARPSLSKRGSVAR